MNKITEKKIEEYPRHVIGGNNPYNRGYNAGYDQAFQDFMERACDWLSKQPMSSPVFWTVEDFKNYMQNESKN